MYWVGGTTGSIGDGTDQLSDAEVPETEDDRDDGAFEVVALNVEAKFDSTMALKISECP